MKDTEVTTSKGGSTFTTYDFTLNDKTKPLPPETIRHNEIKRELRNIASSIDGLCVLLLILIFVVGLKGCGG